MPLVGIILETPLLERVGLPIFTLAEYEINREINAVSSWSLSFPCAERLAAQVKSRWRVSIVEEGHDGYLLRRGIVTSRTKRVASDGSGVLSLQGYGRLFKAAGQSTHAGLEYDGSMNIKALSEDLLDETVIAPTGFGSIFPVVTYNEITKLSALLGANEYARYNVRETWDEDIELVMQDDVPDSGYAFVLGREAGSDKSTAAARGLGLIAGAPTIGHDGGSLATRIIPSAMDFDGSPLTLEHSNIDSPFVRQQGTNPDGSSFWYLQDATADEVIEEHFVRSDVKNPNDNPADRTASANVLYMLTASKLLRTKRETITFGSEIANGNKIWALPGSRAQVRFVGNALTPWGTFAWEELDRAFLIVKRRDVGALGVRRVSFMLSCPEIPLAIPSLPTAHPIPPPDSGTTPEPPDMKEEMSDEGDPEIEELDEQALDLPPAPELTALLENMLRGRGAFQPCCADWGTAMKAGESDVPFDIVPGVPVDYCAVKWSMAAHQDCRFIDTWGASGVAAPHAQFGWVSLDPNRDRAILTLSSGSADPVGVVSGGDIHLLDAWDSDYPANFGGDTHVWWRVYYLVPTSDTIDLAGTNGAFRNITFFKCSQDLPNDLGTYGDGVDLNWVHDLQYSGSHFGFASELADASQSTVYADALWTWMDSGYRTFDDVQFFKTFHHEDQAAFDHDFTSPVNSDLIPRHADGLSGGGGGPSNIDWMLMDIKDSNTDPLVEHEITATYRVDATALTLEGACRTLAVANTLRLRALCPVTLL